MPQGLGWRIGKALMLGKRVSKLGKTARATKATSLGGHLKFLFRYGRVRANRFARAHLRGQRVSAFTKKSGAGRRLALRQGVGYGLLGASLLAGHHAYRKRFPKQPAQPARY